MPQLFESPTQVYKGRDPHFPIMKIPDGEVDVAAVSRSLPPQSNRRRSLTFPRTQQEYISSSAVQQQQNLRSVNKRQNNSRNLEEKSGIVPGEGWTVIGHPAGFCDGTSNAECHREPDTDCLMGGHNDSRGILLGDGLSGW